MLLYLGIRPGAREQIKDTKKILKTAAVVSRRVGREEHARRGGEKGGMVVVGEETEKKKDALSQPSGRVGDKLTGLRVLGNP